MPRNNFFSNVSTDDSAQHLSVDSLKPTTETVPAQPASKRLTYSIKIDPSIRKEIKDWAVQHDVTISSVIETLVRIHLKELSVDDITR